MDGGYIMSGYTTSTDMYTTGAWMIKTDDQGIMQWSKSFGSKNNCVSQIIHQMKDGGYLLELNTRDGFGNINGIASILRLDQNGNQLWSKITDQDSVSGTYFYNHVLYISDDEIIVVGNRDGGTLYLFDSNGSLKLMKTFDLSQCRIFSVNKTNDKGYILSGRIDRNQFGSEFLFIKIDRLSNVQWQKVVMNESIAPGIFKYGSGIVTSTIQLKDDCYVAAGWIIPFSGNQGTNIYTVKLASNGCERVVKKK